MLEDAIGIIEAVKDLGVLGFVFVFIVLVLHKIRDITDFYKFYSNRNTQLIESSLKDDLVSGLTKDHLEETIENNIYKKIKKVNWERPFREAVLQLHFEPNGNATFRKIKRAVFFIKHKDGDLIVKVTCLEKLFFRIAWLVAIAMLLLGIAIFAVGIMSMDSFVSSSTNWKEFIIKLLSWIGLTLLYTFSAVWLLKQCQALKLALEIDEQLAKRVGYVSQVERCNIRAVLNSLWSDIKNNWKNIKGMW